MPKISSYYVKLINVDEIVPPDHEFAEWGRIPTTDEIRKYLFGRNMTPTGGSRNHRGDVTLPGGISAEMRWNEQECRAESMGRAWLIRISNDGKQLAMYETAPRTYAGRE